MQSVRRYACLALGHLCLGDAPEVLERKKRTADAGAIELLVEAMDSFEENADLQEYGAFALTCVCEGDAAGLVLTKRAYKAGAVATCTHAMRKHPRKAGLQEYGCCLIERLCADSMCKHLGAPDHDSSETNAIANFETL